MYHPNAYLHHVKNIKSGLNSRTKILNVLDKQPASAVVIAKTAEISYYAVRHHLKLLEVEDMVRAKGKRPHVWLLTGLGQRRLLT